VDSATRTGKTDTIGFGMDLDTYLSRAWAELVLAALNRNAGQLLPGLGHNLHNYAHAFSMQMEMWSAAMGKTPDLPFSSQQRSLQRMVDMSTSFSRECRILSKRTEYTTLEPVSIHLPSVLDWLPEFWRHNLLFKHHVRFEVTLSGRIPEDITLRPAGLLYALEEGIKNAVESLGSWPQLQGEFSLALDVAEDNGWIAFALSSPTQLDPSIAPWQAGASTKPGHMGLGLPLLRICCHNLGWQCRLSGDDQTTTLLVAIPL
jgi:hypothetical protein